MCDKPDIQPLLPQVVVGNGAAFLVKDFVALQAASPRYVHLANQKNAWNNLMPMARSITILAFALRRHLVESQPILLLDASQTH